jgi:hypothetical protein
VFLEFCLCFLEGLKLFLGSGDLVWYQINVDRGYHACDKFMRGLLEGIMFPQIVCIFCYGQKLCPTSGV